MAINPSSDPIQSTDPRTGASIGSFSPTPVSEIQPIVDKARIALGDWSEFKTRTRIELFRKAYREFYRAREELAELISAETGKPLVEAYSSEILPCLDCFKYYLKNYKKLLKKVSVRAQNPLLKLRRGFVTYEPIGVVAVLSPWNYPLLLALQHIIPALLVGNVVIHKPSEHTTLTAKKIREIFDRAYLPRNVLRLVVGYADVGQELVSSHVDKIFFTGSTQVGRRIYQKASGSLTPVNMELGGSDPMIVLPDANIERAINGAVWGAFSNAGQTCVSVERLFVHSDIFEEFLERLTKRVNKIRLTPDRETADVSCLLNAEQINKIISLVGEAELKGAIVHCGGVPNTSLGNLFYEPTVISRVDSSMRMSAEEIFGPVVSVTSFSSDEEALFLANQSCYGLSASIWTEDLKRGMCLAKKIVAAAVHINEIMVHLAQFEAPYCGWKNSGIGVSHGPWGLMEMVRTKYVTTERGFIGRFLKLFFKDFVNSNIWWFPYGSERVNDFEGLLSLLHGESRAVRFKAVPAALRAIFRKKTVD